MGKPVYSAFATIWRLALGGVFVFALSGAAAYYISERLIERPEALTPNLVTLDLEQALEKASREGFPLIIDSREPTELLEEGRILTQRPSPEMWSKVGSAIRVTVASRP